MSTTFRIENGIFDAVWIFTMILQAWAVVDCLIRKTAAFPAVNKLTKPAWIGLTLIAFVIQLLLRGPVNIIGMAAVIVALVYLADVRPAVREVAGPHRW